MKRPHASDDVRTRAFAALDAGKPVTEVAEFFGVDPTTIRRWRRQRAVNGSGLLRSRSGRPRTIAPAQEPQLQQVVAAQPDATLAQLCATWTQQTGVQVSVSTMGNQLRRMKSTLKKRP